MLRSRKGVDRFYATDVIIMGKHSQNSLGALTPVVARFISFQRLSLPPERTTCSHMQEGEASTKSQGIKITGSSSMSDNTKCCINKITNIVFVFVGAVTFIELLCHYYVLKWHICEIVWFDWPIIKPSQTALLSNWFVSLEFGLSLLNSQPL